VFNPRTFLEFARQLSLPNLGEVEYSTAIGRAYYSVFLVAREELNARGGEVKQQSPIYANLEHSKVRERFRTGRFKHSGVASRLRDLYLLKVRADYEIAGNAITKEHVDQALEYADYIFRVFDRLLFRGSTVFQDQP